MCGACKVTGPSRDGLQTCIPGTESGTISLTSSGCFAAEWQIVNGERVLERASRGEWMDRGSQRWGGLRVPFQAWSGAQGGSPRLAREAAALGPTWSTCPGVSQGDLCRGHGLQVHSIADLEVMPLQTCQGLRAAFASFSARSRIVVRFVGVITSWSFVPKTPSLKLFFQTLSSLLRGPSWLPSEQTSMLFLANQPIFRGFLPRFSVGESVFMGKGLVPPFQNLLSGSACMVENPVPL